MERDRALKYLRLHYKVPAEYEKKIPKDLVIIIEKLISKNPDNRPTAKELLNNYFVDPANMYANDKKLNASFAQFTYYLNYKDFTTPFTRYQNEMEILDYVTKECK